jgi:hypothetical protein
MFWSCVCHANGVVAKGLQPMDYGCALDVLALTPSDLCSDRARFRGVPGMKNFTWLSARLKFFLSQDMFYLSHPTFGCACMALHASAPLSVRHITYRGINKNRARHPPRRRALWLTSRADIAINKIATPKQGFR